MGRDGVDVGSVPIAHLGPEAELAGESVLVHVVPTPWRSYGLWGLLLASVGIVLALSLRLLRRADG